MIGQAEGFFNLLCSAISLLPVVFRMMHKIVLMLGFNFFRAHMKVSEKAHTVKMTKGFYQHLKLSFFPLQKYLRTYIWFLFSFFSSSCCLLMNVQKKLIWKPTFIELSHLCFYLRYLLQICAPLSARAKLLNRNLPTHHLYPLRATLSDIVPYSWVLLHTMWFMR